MYAKVIEFYYLIYFFSGKLLKLILFTLVFFWINSKISKNLNSVVYSWSWFQDLGLANNAAKDTNSAVSLGQQAFEIYTKITEKGYGGKDFSVIFKILEEMSGPEVEKKKKEFFDQWV